MLGVLLYALAGYVTNAMRERYVEVYTWRMESGDVQLDFMQRWPSRSA